MDLPILDFIQTRLSEADATLEVRKGTAFYDTYIKPQQFMLQPYSDEMDELIISQSIRKILQQSDPDAFDTELVDGLVSNIYIYRDQGGFAATTIRVFYSAPADKEFPAQGAEFIGNGLSYFNTQDIVISAAEMALNISGNLYYFDAPIAAQTQGSNYNTDVDTITTFVNDPDAVSVTNLSPAIDGLTAETNTQLLNRGADSIGVRDLETIKGINGILRSKFPFIQEIQSIGMGDPEMMRDIIYNAHVGGNTDIYIKTPSVTTKTQNFVGLQFDATRQLARTVYRVLKAKGTDTPTTGFNDPTANLKTPFIAANSVSVTEAVVPTQAIIRSGVIPPSGIDLSANEYLKIQVDAFTAVNIKVSGVVPATTQRSEIINSINFVLGLQCAFTSGTDKIEFRSPSFGSGSLLSFQTPDLPRTDATNLLFGAASPFFVSGTGPVIYVEGAANDYVVDYTNGKIKRTITSNIKSGDVIISPTPTGVNSIAVGGCTTTNLSSAIGISSTAGLEKGMRVIGTGVPIDTFIKVINSPTTFTTTQNSIATGTATLSFVKDFIYDTTFSSPAPFQNPPPNQLRVGDLVYITSIDPNTGIIASVNAPAIFPVSEILSNSKIRLQDFSPRIVATGITYYVVSNQTVVIRYKYAPVSVDIGPLVILSDGVSRGVRPNRDNYTIKDVPFLAISSIEEIDSDTGEPLGVLLQFAVGYGAGGYGVGGFGGSPSGDYRFIVNRPTERFSCFEDSVIIFDPSWSERSIQVAYYAVPEILPIHTLSRDDTERVTGADVLPKHFVPGFVDVTIQVKRDPTNSTTPDNAGLSVLAANLINSVPTFTQGAASKGLEASALIAMLEGQGVEYVQVPFDMTMTVMNTDGSSRIITSNNVLIHPDVTLPRQTDNYVTPRIVHLIARNVVVEDAT